MSPNWSETFLWTLGPSPYSWMRTSGWARDSSIDMSAGKGSYSTSIRRQARSAVAAVDEETAERLLRSEERRVGKEGRSRGSPDREKKKQRREDNAEHQ